MSETELIDGLADLASKRVLWVSPNGRDSADGSQDAPLRSIQEAADRATPGTAIMVREGVYRESVEIDRSGTPDAPIRLVSADGKGAAEIVAQGSSAIYGYGEENIVIRGFEISGGRSSSATNGNGILFTQSLKGTPDNDRPDFMQDVVRNIVIEDNIIRDARVDGIKIAQGFGIVIRDNLIDGGSGQEGIDLVTVEDALIAGNEIRGISGNAGLTMKGGSQDIRVEGNHIHDVPEIGIRIGGASESSKIPKGVDFEVRDAEIVGNYVYDTGGNAVAFIGAHESSAVDNVLESLLVRDSTNRGGPVFHSRDLTVTGNTVLDDDWLSIRHGLEDEVDLADNRSGSLDGNWKASDGAGTGTDGPADIMAFGTDCY